MSKLKISSDVKVPYAPPRGEPETLDVYFRGSNVLVDPGFENFVYASGGWYWRDRVLKTGSSNNTIPYINLACPQFLQNPDGSCVESSFSTWAQTSGPYIVNDLAGDQAWKVTAIDPYEGFWHAAWWNWGNGSIPPGELCAFNPYISGPFSARVQPGDNITLSFRVKGPGGGAVGVENAFTITRFYTSSFVLINVVQGAVTPLTTSYQLISHSTITPPGSVYIRASIAFSGDFTSQAGTYVDAAVMAVT